MSTIKVGAFTGTTPGTYNNITAADAQKVSYGLSDVYNDTTTPLTIPSGSNRTFSWIKNLALYCTVTTSTTLSNVTGTSLAHAKRASGVLARAWASRVLRYPKRGTRVDSSSSARSEGR